MLITKSMKIDLVERIVLAPVHAVQCDANTRAVAVTLTAAGVAWTPPAGAAISVAFRKPDGKKGWYDKLPDGSNACSVSGNVVTAILAPEVLTEAGSVDVVIVFQDGSLNQLATFGFAVLVEKNPAAGIGISNDYYNYTTMADVNQAMEEFFTKAEVEQTAFVEKVEKNQAAFLEVAGAALEAVHEAATADATAIVCEASGELIAVSDASDRLVRGLKVFGKTTQATTTGANLWDEEWELGAVASSNGSNTDVTTQIRSKNYIPVTPGAELYIVIPDSTQFTGKFFDSNKSPIGSTWGINTSVSRAITVPAEAYYLRFTMQPSYGIEYKNNIAVNYPATATAYEPYTGGVPSPSPDYPQELVSVGDSGSAGVTLKGKNLLHYPYYDRTKTIYGVTFTDNGDGSVTANGTATGGNAYFSFYISSANADHLQLEIGKRYTVSGCPAGGSPSTYSIRIQNLEYTQTEIDAGSGITFTARYPLYYGWIDVKNGTTVNNLTFYPMVRRASIVDATYEPYKPAQTLTFATPNGLPGIPVESGGNYTDENGQQYIANYRDWGRGVDVQRVKKSALSALLGINRCSDGMVVVRFASDAKAGIAPLSSVFCGKTTTGDWQDVECVSVNSITDTYVYITINASRIGIDTSTATTNEATTAVRNYLNEHPVDITYVTTTPIETPIPEEELAAYWALHTNKPNTTVYNDAGAHMELSYVADTKLYIDNKFAELSAAIVSNT